MNAVATVEESLQRIAARDGTSKRGSTSTPTVRRRRPQPRTPRFRCTASPSESKISSTSKGMPTTWGTPIYAGNIAVKDAACVALVRAAGAIVLGKTVTTEFAFVAPSRTRNPWNPAHTPGGSSSGSAAAVADGHVRAAFGSQTMGSVLRPAAFCGVVGYKPTLATISLDGAHAVAPSFDTLGWMTRSVDDAALLRSALLDIRAARSRRSVAAVGVFALVGLAEGAARHAGDGGRSRCGVRGAGSRSSASTTTTPVFFAIANFEMRQSLATERLQHFDRLRPQTQIADRHGRVRLSRAPNGRASRLERFDVNAAFGDAEVLLMPASTGEAPDLTTTGDPVFNRLASLLGLPAITIPAKLGPAGLPLGMQLIARRYEDDALLRAARAVERRFPFTATPPAN